MPWSNEPLVPVATHNITFQQLYAKLEALLQLEKEATLANVRDSAGHLRRTSVPENTTAIQYTGQERYMNDLTGQMQTMAKPAQPFNRGQN